MPGPGLQAPNVMCVMCVETSRSSRRRAAAHIGVAGRPRSRQRRHGLAHTVAQRPESNKQTPSAPASRTGTPPSLGQIAVQSSSDSQRYT